MHMVVYLTAEERAAFDALPADIREGWDVQEETLDCYESYAQLQMRYNLADFDMYPDMKNWAEKIQNGEGIDGFSVDHIDPVAQNELFFVMGARGMKTLIDTVLGDISDDEDVRALSELSTVRHKLLEINSSAVYS